MYCFCVVGDGKVVINVYGRVWFGWEVVVKCLVEGIWCWCVVVGVDLEFVWVGVDEDVDFLRGCVNVYYRKKFVDLLVGVEIRWKWNLRVEYEYWMM